MATSAERIFRKVALERLSSPEQLDQLVPLTSPIGWAAVVAIAAILAAAIGWSIFGTLHVEATVRDAHHVAEAAHKAVGRALREAMRRDGAALPSTKGML